ncbi:MAG TPA: peptidoglycan-associated lipoprotein Pal [Candidatus Eisenbacteria bacterium]|nr:peptidoglycan-associated lipoprotein Pal [Candidatus Eisenbacteria bacterium]
MLRLSWLLLIPMALIGCTAETQHVQNQAPRWTVENPDASRGIAKGSAAGAQRDAATQVSTSSLDSLQMGQSTATPDSSPLKDVNFDFDSHELTEQARGILKNNAEWLKANPSVRVQIEGHCDERGTVEYNLALGARRAKNVKDYLATLGIAVERLSDISYGEEIPLCRERTEACWEKNRRARFVITAGGPAA